jgi:hypothetical protein
MTDRCRIKIEDSELLPLQNPYFSSLGPFNLLIALVIRDEKIPCEVGKITPRNLGYFPFEERAEFALDLKS